MTESTLTELTRAYRSNELTMDGYVLGAISALSLTEIRLQWLADTMEISYGGLAKSLKRLRDRGRISLRTVHPRKRS